MPTLSPPLWRRTFKRVTFVSSLSLTSALLGYYSYDPGFRREVEFWRQVSPIAFRYLIYTVRGLDLSPLHGRYSPRARDICEQLGGLYIKMGQVLSVRPEILPEAYRLEFAKLQDTAPPASFDEVIKPVLEESLGHSVSDLFSYVDPVPLGSASIGQAHAATLLDGREVVLKVQYPDAKARFKVDLHCLSTLANWMTPAFSQIMEEFEIQFLTEFDYHNEARNITEIRREVLDATDQWRGLVNLPEVIPEYTTDRVLCMTLVPGEKLETVIRKDWQRRGVDIGPDFKEWLRTQQRHRQEIDTRLRSAASCWLLLLPAWAIRAGLWVWRAWSPSHSDMSSFISTAVRVHGYELFACTLFNGDPHPGNLLVDLNTGKVGLIDYGQCKRMDDKTRLKLARLVVAVADGVPQEEAKAMVEAGIRTARKDERYLSIIARLLFGRIEPYMLDPQFHLDLHKSDQIESLPGDTLMGYRVAMLLRGLALATRHSISVAELWKDEAQKCIERGGRTVFNT
ncbi:hypothetical protein FOL47_007011 [Perkinsus chesapeaki]|uniref:ABC1 atypical kinase-like domain-containing protein n=1 Tax=Perkinsus chesapeaki TaxID=330153 RepID=A0A7J6MWY6_PERCH|nr:hypothetical protein FOL47_007011 [Perkinsus chesapeaki]